MNEMAADKGGVGSQMQLNHHKISYRFSKVQVVSNKVPSGKQGFKVFLGYKNDWKVRLSCVFLPKKSAHRRNFDETKYMSFLIIDGELLEKCKK